LGEKCARLFESALGIRFEGEPEQVTAELASSAGLVNVNGVWQNVLLARAETVGVRYPTRDTRQDGEPAATVVPHGRGQIGAAFGPVALAYFRNHHPSLRRFIGDLAQRLFPDPQVRTTAPPGVDLALRRTSKGQLSLHLLNLAEAQRAGHFLSTDFVPTVGPFEVQILLPEPPRRVRWVPERRRLKWSWADGTLSVTIPSLHIHGVVVVE